MRLLWALGLAVVVGLATTDGAAGQDLAPEVAVTVDNRLARTATVRIACADEKEVRSTHRVFGVPRRYKSTINVARERFDCDQNDMYLVATTQPGEVVVFGPFVLDPNTTHIVACVREASPRLFVLGPGTPESIIPHLCAGPQADTRVS